jgi:hypothetical protein
VGQFAVKQVGHIRVKHLGQFAVKQVGHIRVKRLGQITVKQVGQNGVKFPNGSVFQKECFLGCCKREMLMRLCSLKTNIQPSLRANNKFRNNFMKTPRLVYIFICGKKKNTRIKNWL